MIEIMNGEVRITRVTIPSMLGNGKPTIKGRP